MMNYGRDEGKSMEKVKRKEEEGGDHLYGNTVFVLYLYCNIHAKLNCCNNTSQTS
jgi:hypothetical protein